jgi:hypothetical protein
MTDEGRRLMSKEPGDWYGVNSIAQVIKKIFSANTDEPESHLIFKKMSFLTF